MAKAQSLQGINGSIWSHYRQKKKSRSKDGGKTLKKRSTYATVTDVINGYKPAPPGMLPQVRCPIPRTRREKYFLGSPMANKA